MYTVLLGDSVLECTLRGIFRKNNNSIIVGDFVEVNENEKIIEKLYPRKCELIRPKVSNIDKILIVTSVKEPDLNLYLLDKMICYAEFLGLEIILIFTKIDLLREDDEYNYTINYYKNIGYKVILKDKLKVDEELKSIINSSVVALAGQSGVGKSSLINLLSDLSLKTDKISRALGRGKHTTRIVEFHSLLNGFIIDTPGFGNLEFEINTSSLKSCFIEFLEYNDCKFRECLHIKEINCLVKSMVDNNTILKSRYSNYLKIYNELKEKRYDY